jgi:uridine phosphorylase
VVTEALACDGTSRALGAGERIAATESVLDRLQAAGGTGVRCGPIVSTDLFYDTPPGTEEDWRERGALAVEMEAATLFALAHARGFDGGCALIVSDTVLPARRRIDEDALRTSEHQLGELALKALAREAGP